ncbi:hypothetical protein [Roseomonas gilardii]|uniref:hypothetical protein n=1 Tax=Roseomonas gilardii TaxID=257708 RepID=UPI0012EBE261|nr:hypothetical protein [Roseomonas gilardii]
MQRLAVSALLLVLSCVSAHSQPFGISEGTPRSAIKIEEEVRPGWLRIVPPRKHPEFELFHVQITQETGVCRLSAAGITHSNDRYGRSVRSAFQEVREQLEATYGKSGLNDFLKTGALWKNDEEWVMSIRQNERIFQAAWGKPSGAPIKNGVTEVLLNVAALDQSKSYLRLQFVFSNFDKCERLRKAGNASVF